MRATRSATLALSLLLGAATLVQAGVYSTFEKGIGPSVGTDGAEPLPLTGMQLLLTDLLLARDPSKDTEKRRDYIKHRDELLAKEMLSVEEKVDLSASLLRLGQYDEAINQLRPLARERNLDDFRVAANLAVAYLLSNEFQSAVDNLEQAIKLLKKTAPKQNLSKEQIDWYLEAEQALLKLVRLRRKEAAALAGAKGKPPEAVDDLFGVQFIGDSGAYEAGKLATAQAEKLPKNATVLVEQLLCWMPDDARLYWLYGELLNARGNVGDAKKVLDECAWTRGLNAPELRQHGHVLEESLAQADQPSETSGSWIPDNQKLLLVGGGLGLLVLGFAALQVREMRRRRQAHL